MTNDEKKKLYQLLSAPFPESSIQRTEGRLTGRGYDTSGIGYQHIVNRLNEVLGLGCFRAHRTVTVKEVKRSNGRPAFESICDLTLELGHWEAGNFVVFAESLADGGHVAASEADARKGAFTSAFKKAAAFHGVGKQAYEGSLEEPTDAGDGESPAPVTTVVRAPVISTPVQAVPQGYTQTPDVRLPVQERNRLSSRQLSAIWSIARKLGLDQSGFRAQTRAQYGCQLEFINRNQASEVITNLNARLNSNGNGQHVAAQPATTDGAA